LGRVEDARREFNRLTEGDLEFLQKRGMDWIFILAVLGELCCFFNDQSRARHIYNRLSRFAGRNVTLFHMANFGSVSMYLAKLAVILDRADEAISHFEKALTFSEAVGASPWIAETQYEYARMLISKNTGTDRERAAAFLNNSRRLSEQIGNLRLLSKIGNLWRPDGGFVAPEVSLGPVSPGVDFRDFGSQEREQRAPTSQPAKLDSCSLSREGEYWTFSFETRTIRIKDSKGLGYIDTLLKYSNREFHALNLVTMNAIQGDSEISNDPSSAVVFSTAEQSKLTVSHDLGDSGAMLDSSARRAYRERLKELQEELAKAKARGDVTKAIDLESEIDALQHELRRAVGLRGRDRYAGSASERARLNVTRAIKASISRIAEHDSALARHLAMSIKTGIFCSYVPNRMVISSR
jgi:hypothetical protein